VQTAASQPTTQLSLSLSLSLCGIVKTTLALTNSIQSTLQIRHLLLLSHIPYVVHKGEYCNGGKIDLDIFADLQVFSISQ
jgi:hypothetical protein